MIQYYVDSFKGLSKEIWLLSFSFLINRAGTMVIPFLSLYMSDELGFSLGQIGWIMTFFGLGSLVGSWTGGKLSDVFSFYEVMVASMFLSGLGFMALVYFHSFLGVALAIFIQMSISDAFRPAAFSAIDAYCLPENRVRSISLVRLFINLGYSIGPAVGGFIFYRYSANFLFYIDGLTCLASAIFILLLLKPKHVDKKKEKADNDRWRQESKSVYSDFPYLIMMLILFLFNLAFFQIFANLPLFYKEIHMLNENTIGWIMAGNGILIFVLEMPLVNYLENKRFNTLKIVLWACLFLAASYLLLNLTMWFWILIISMMLLTVSEMLAFPFTNSWSLSKAPKGRVGEYMGLYTAAFSLSHIIGPNMGMQVSSNFGFHTSWYLMGFLGMCSALLCLYLIKLTKARQ